MFQTQELMVVIEARPAAGPLHTGEPAPGRPGLYRTFSTTLPRARLASR